MKQLHPEILYDLTKLAELMNEYAGYAENSRDVQFARTFEIGKIKGARYALHAKKLRAAAAALLND